MAKRPLTKRQLSIVGFISERKKMKPDPSAPAKITLEEILQHCEDKNLLSRVSESSKRSTAIVTMRLLVDRLRSSGVYIEAPRSIGRGAKAYYLI